MERKNENLDDNYCSFIKAANTETQVAEQKLTKRK